MFDITKEDILSVITGEKIITGDKVRVVFRVDMRKLDISRPMFEKYIRFLMGRVKELFPEYETLVIPKEIDVNVEEIKDGK